MGYVETKQNSTKRSVIIFQGQPIFWMVVLLYSGGVVKQKKPSMLVRKVFRGCMM